MTVFDLFGRKRIAVLEQSLEGASVKLAHSLRVNLALDAKCSGQNAQIIQLRGIAEGLRNRIQSHGKTEEEHRFITACLDIYRNNKTISPRRFHAAMGAVTREREQMEDWAIEGDRLTVGAQELHENADKVKTEAF